MYVHYCGCLVSLCQAVAAMGLLCDGESEYALETNVQQLTANAYAQNFVSVHSPTTQRCVALR